MQIKDKIQGAEKIALIINVVLLGLGFVMMLAPGASAAAATITMGCILTIYGAIAFFVLLGKKEGKWAATPLLCIALGVLLLVFNGFFANIALPLILGAWMIILGVVGILGAIEFKPAGAWRLSLILSLVAMATGVLILSGLAMNVNVAAAFTGFVLVIYGAVEIANWFVMRRLEKHAAKNLKSA